MADIRTKCWTENLASPSRKAIHARIVAIDLHKRIQSREGNKSTERVTPRPGGMIASAPNEIWLIDHTLADMILLDRRYRLPIGRPTITLVIDAFTRMCVGCYVSLGAPSTIQTAMALLRSFMPKEALLENAGVEWSWPCHGLPKILYSDNGRDFKSVAIRRGLDTYGIAQEFRPVSQPRYGAIIERFIGTMMGELHLVAMIGIGASEPTLKQLRAKTLDLLPSLRLKDVHRPHSLTERIGKGCEACLSEDADEGRDHYLRADWCLSWQISCKRHRYPLTDLTRAVLVPLTFEGTRQYRVRFIRDVDLIINPFHRRKDYRGGRQVIVSSLALCLEQDIYAALQGAPLQKHWCLGSDWEAARTALLEVTDLLLTPMRGSSEHLIHLLADNDRIPAFREAQFAREVFPSFGALGQRKILECAARLLIDPHQFDHWQDGHQLNVHSELSYGKKGAIRSRNVLGQLATSDLFSLLLTYMDERRLEEWVPRFRCWPAPLSRRIQAAAAVALYTH